MTLTEEQRDKLIKSVILGGIGIAGASSLAGALHAKKSREKAYNVKDNKGVIIVPIKKTKFMEKLPSPDEFKKSYEEKHGPVVGLLPNEPAGQLSQEDIDSKKKLLLASAGRNMNYFGKAAESCHDVAVVGKETSETAVRKDSSDGDKDSDEIKLDMRRSRAGEGVRSPAEKDEKDSQPRDEKGRFSSKEEGSEKRALVEEMANEAVMWPVGITASAIGMMWLAGKISNQVAKIRASSAEAELESAQRDYLKKLENSGEKKASDDGDGPGVSGWIARTGGAAFIVPMLFSAMIANRVMEKRYEDKKKAKEDAGGIPDEPIIMYKTSSGDEIQVSPETVMAAILVKSAMLDSIEEAEGRSMEKSAGLWEKLWKRIRHPTTFSSDGETMYDLGAFAKTFNNGKATDATWDFIDANPQLVKNISSFGGGRGGETRAGFNARLKTAIDEMRKNGLNESQISDFLSGREFQDYMVDRFENDESLRESRDKMVNEHIRKRFGDNWFGQFIQWLANATGLGGWLFNRNLRSGMNGLAGKVYTDEQRKADAEAKIKAQRKAEAIRNAWAELREEAQINRDNEESYNNQLEADRLRMAEEEKESLEKSLELPSITARSQDTPNPRVIKMNGQEFPMVSNPAGEYKDQVGVNVTFPEPVQRPVQRPRKPQLNAPDFDVANMIDDHINSLDGGMSGQTIPMAGDATGAVQNRPAGNPGVGVKTNPAVSQSPDWKDEMSKRFREYLSSRSKGPSLTAKPVQRPNQPQWNAPNSNVSNIPRGRGGR